MMTPATFKTYREIMGLSVEDLSAAMADETGPGPNPRTVRGWESPREKYALPDWAAQWMQTRWAAWLDSVAALVDGVADQIDTDGEPEGIHISRPPTTLQEGERSSRVAAITLLLEAEGIPVTLDYDTRV